MKRIILFLLLMCSAFSVSYSQCFYTKLEFGSDISLYDLNHYNQPISVQLGYDFNCYESMEFDYTCGYEKYDVSYHRIGVNYVHEFYNETDALYFPFIKFGAAYKSYDYGKYKDEFGDFKLGFGVNAYYSSRLYFSFGVDVSVAVNSEVAFDLENAICKPYIGVGFKL